MAKISGAKKYDPGSLSLEKTFSSIAIVDSPVFKRASTTRLFHLTPFNSFNKLDSLLTRYQELHDCKESRSQGRFRKQMSVMDTFFFGSLDM